MSWPLLGLAPFHFPQVHPRNILSLSLTNYKCKGWGGGLENRQPP
jgi:hypothetical protein